jgi:hypothetical protein
MLIVTPINTFIPFYYDDNNILIKKKNNKKGRERRNKTFIPGKF